MTMPDLQPNTHYCIANALQYFNINIDILLTNEMVNDSRKVNSGDIFCAVIGNALNGSQYIEQAINNGAVLIIKECEQLIEHGQLTVQKTIDGEVRIVNFYHLNQQLFELASQYYQQPQHAMKVVGITGTNGKTSTALMVNQLLSGVASIDDKSQCAVIGTVGAGTLGNLQAIDNTTPGATELLTLIAKFKQQNIAYLAMEVSSHALVQKRVDANLFDIAVFTNLSRDHLDYHHTMADYAAAKMKIFSSRKDQISVINGDDDYASTCLERVQGSVIVYGKNTSLKKHTRYLIADKIHHHHNGVSFLLLSHLGNVEINSSLLGDFNIDNLLAAMSVMVALEFTLTDIVNRVNNIEPVIGRMESFHVNNKPLAIVDYAHTPDGLLNALKACKQHNSGQLWLVFGCGGDRDQGKRAQMGNIAEQYADHIVISNDNPRNEDPENIVKDILSGCQHTESIRIILDREEAVKTVLQEANINDIVLLAGKGHEEGIVIKQQKIAYNERQFVKALYQEVCA
jgi:UDP-N-acetylmuramoyl-L-alanyl-D-glutamate--2,6-diaminopimelate ligase